MRPTALIFLRDNPAAQRMAVAWPAAFPGDVEGRLARWAAAADVHPALAEKLAHVLAIHGIVRPDGTVEPDAENYVAAVVSASIPRRKK